MKTIITTLLFITTFTFSKAQINGCVTVSAGYTYTYAATIAGATNYIWTFPIGWYDITGQGTGNLTITCNVSAGNICAEGFDVGGISVGTLCINTQFAGGAAGWDVQPSAIAGCSFEPFTVSIVPNGTGNSAGCPGSCGSGSLHPNIHYALYNNTWPLSQFIIFADGMSSAIVGLNQGNAYVYQVDITNGSNPPQAVLIEGGCGSATVNNVCNISVYLPILPAFSQTPSAPCIGDTVQLYETTGIINPCWGCGTNLSGLNVIGSVWSNPLIAVVTNSNPAVDVTGLDANGCTTAAIYNVATNSCVSASLTGDTTVCAGHICNYSATIPGAVTYNWTFPTGWYEISGQGTFSATATCNINAGNICVEGFDALNNSVGTVCITTQFGGGGSAGWDVTPASVYSCLANPQPFSISITPNGSSGGGSCPSGCGSGTQSADIVFAVYNGVWPACSFVQYADGVSPIVSTGYNTTYYVYQVDVTSGLNPPQAVVIEGGCGGGTVNNSISLSVIWPTPPSISSTPNPACIGDTVTVYDGTGLINSYWNVSSGGILLNNNINSIDVVITGNPCDVYIEGLDPNTYCFTATTYSPLINCNTGTVAGDTIVCSGYTYNYTASIPGALTYSWTLPAGWYNITGQGSANVTATCNVNAGNICVEGFDASGNSLGTTCITTQFGGGMPVGWDVQPQSFVSCLNDPISLNIVPNSSGSGSCPNGCGSGIPITSVGYGIYDNVWPAGNFVGFADGSSISNPLPPGSYTYYIYYVDYTAGTSTTQAILIQGGCGITTNNNIVQFQIPFPTGVGFFQFPDPVCIGDTVYINAGANNGSNWGAIMGITIVSASGLDLIAIVNSLPARAQFNGIDFYGCPVSGICYINAFNCNSTLAGDSVVCTGITYNYSANTPGAVSYDWLFPPGWYNITGQGTPNASATCNGTNGWISVSGYNGSGNLISNNQLLAQVASPTYCSGVSITGDSVVCAGYIYSYSATIAGAVNYTWTFPAGWYDITGQGTSSVTATCNLNDGNICVEGFNAGGVSLGTECIITAFGGGGFTGWDVQPSSVSGCNGMPFTLAVLPNGTGGGSGCPAGCGSGSLHPNIVYGIYDAVWPNGYYFGNADGFTSFILGGMGVPVGTVYIYLVDISNGGNPPQAIKIDGGCGSGVVNNSCNISPFMPNPPAFSQTPIPACIGDTIQLTEVTGLTNIGWGVGGFNDLNLINGQFSNPLTVVVTGNNPYTDVTGTDANGCMTYLPLVAVTVGTCAVPFVQFSSSDTTFCDKQSINFTDLSTNNPTNWQWIFQGAAPSTSTDQNPQNIYYATSGSFDVTLIACNNAGCDTITLAGFIVEHNAAYDSIYKSNDTLYSIPASSYQWYEVTSGIITGATSQYYVPAVAGNYYCISSDSLGCSDASNTIAITTGIELGFGNWQLSINPNPNDGIFQIVLITKFQISNLKTEIINVLGETIFEKEFQYVNGEFTSRINLLEQPKGIYFLKLILDGATTTTKIILK